jgi:hypothetical protein
VKKAGPLDGPGESFLTVNLAPRLRLYVRVAPKLKVRYRTLAFFVAACGLASSVIAGAGNVSGDTASVFRYVVIALGLAVGLFTQLLQIWRPAERSVAYYHARASLPHEGWDFVYDDGVYAPHKSAPVRQFALFREQVLRVEAAAAAMDEQTESAPTHRRPAARTAQDEGASTQSA